MRCVHNTLAALLGTLLAAAHTQAADRLETVVVYGDRDSRLLSETTSSTAVIDSSALQGAKVEHLHQLLQTVPGVWLSRGSGQEHLTAIRSPVFTGAGACGAFGMTEDGIALRANGFCNANQMFDAHYEAAKQIQVFKGPHTSMVGGNAQFGGINVDLPTALEVDNSVGLRANSAGYRRFSGSYAHKGQNQAGAALLSVAEDDGYRSQSGFDQQKLSLKHHWLDDEWRSIESGLSLMHLEQETAGYVEGEDAYESVLLSRQNSNPEAFRDANSLRLYSRYRQRTLDTEWVVTPYLRSNDMEFLMHFVPWKPLEENSHNSVGWQLQWNRYLSRGSRVFWGQEFDHTWAALTETQSRPAPAFLDDIRKYPQGAHYDYRIAAQSGALYGGGFWQTTQALALDAAARVDYIRYDYTNRLSDGSACEATVGDCRFYRPASGVETYTEPSAHVGAVYHIRNRVYGFTRAALSFRAPQATELYRAQTPGEPEVDAEQTRALELGIRGQRQRFFYELSLYAMANRDGIISDTQGRYVNGVDSQHLGFEYQLQYGQSGDWMLTAAGQIAEHTYRNNPPIEGSAGVNFVGLRMDTAPMHEHSLTAAWWPSQAVSMQAQWHWQGEYYLDPENRFRYDGHHLLDLESRWQLTPKVQLQASILNALDRRYAERADVFREDYRYFPGLERRVAVAIDYTF